MSRHPQETATPVLLIHGSLSGKRMWAPYLPHLAETRPVLAPDLLGYGASPPWLDDRGPSLREEARLLWAGLSGPVDLVAHSYGAAVALRMLVDAPHRVRSLMLIEPSCFFLLKDLGPLAAPARREIDGIADGLRERLGRGQLNSATALFVNYWNGQDAFATFPEERQRALATRIRKVACDFDAIAAERMRFAMLRKLPVPTLIVTGESGPQAPRIIGEAIARVMPRGSSMRVKGAGHMLPLTHVSELSGILARWLTLDEAHQDAKAA